MSILASATNTIFDVEENKIDIPGYRYIRTSPDHYYCAAEEYTYDDFFGTEYDCSELDEVIEIIPENILKQIKKWLCYY